MDAWDVNVGFLALVITLAGWYWALAKDRQKDALPQTIRRASRKPLTPFLSSVK